MIPLYDLHLYIAPTWIHPGMELDLTEFIKLERGPCVLTLYFLSSFIEIDEAVSDKNSEYITTPFLFAVLKINSEFKKIFFDKILLLKHGFSNTAKTLN